jgi:phosphinothricin acetyltransferase
MIRDCTVDDARRICEIYNYYITNTITTFETEEVKVDQMRNRIAENSGKFPWLVYDDNEVEGFAVAKGWKTRNAYQFTAEASVYIDFRFKRKGIGNELYSELIHRLKEISIHSILAGISLPNPESVIFHEKMGFEKVAHLKEVGFKFNQWIDVGYWELIL